MSGTHEQDMKRWRRAIRRQVRLLLAAHGGLEAALLMWVTDSPRKPGVLLTPGQDVVSAGEVKVRVRELVGWSGARFVAVGRPVELEGEMRFFLIVVGPGLVEQWAAPLEGMGVDGDRVLFSGLGGWERVSVREDTTAIVQAGLRDAAAARASLGDRELEERKRRLESTHGVVLP